VSYAPPPTPFAALPYPVAPPLRSAATRRRLSPLLLVLVAVAAIAVVVVIITVAASAARPAAPTHCVYACAPPKTGQRLVSSTSYNNQHWGYTVDYDSTVFQVAQQDTDSVTLGTNGVTAAVVKAMSATSPASAVQATINNLNTSVLQNIQDKNAIPGAEVGEIPGAGEYLTATLVTSQGGTPVALQVMAATQGSMTIVVELVDSPAQGNTVSGIQNTSLDYVLSELIWPGS